MKQKSLFLFILLNLQFISIFAFSLISQETLVSYQQELLNAHSPMEILLVNDKLLNLALESDEKEKSQILMMMLMNGERVYNETFISIAFEFTKRAWKLPESAIQRLKETFKNPTHKLALHNDMILFTQIDAFVIAFQYDVFFPTFEFEIIVDNIESSTMGSYSALKWAAKAWKSPSKYNIRAFNLERAWLKFATVCYKIALIKDKAERTNNYSRMFGSNIPQDELLDYEFQALDQLERRLLSESKRKDQAHRKEQETKRKQEGLRKKGLSENEMTHLDLSPKDFKDLFGFSWTTNEEIKSYVRVILHKIELLDNNNEKAEYLNIILTYSHKVDNEDIVKALLAFNTENKHLIEINDDAKEKVILFLKDPNCPNLTNEEIHLLAELTLAENLIEDNIETVQIRSIPEQGHICLSLF
ncbi:MAG: hypothetical protein ABIA04_08325 [Pseudomonadota bacterium]